MRFFTPANLLKLCVVLGFLALGLMLFLALADRAECFGGWCPPIPCYGGDCAQCFCLQEAYPEPGVCVSLDR